MISASTFGPALARLAADGFVAYPTETVWGLGACADRPRAIERLARWKGRAAGAPMSLLVSSVEAAPGMGCIVEGSARRLIEAFWPGPLTVVVPCRGRFASGVRRADGALGLRCSAHPLAHALAVAVGEAGLGPLTSTSMNRSGEPPARDLGAARALLQASETGDPAEPVLVSDSGHDAGGEAPSSVVDCTGETPEVLRVGAIDCGRLEAVWSR
ncbi:MAG: L-threonylcarbamoyladenylate synthase [Deltaproteobacteria bacterium]|nr:L-threonylcarbamoyladenylate synthase [Deltaproteobacteria bacterium]